LQGAEVAINYLDNGSGLDQEGKEKIFELFYTTKRNTNCTGLGMPIVYNQVTQKLLGSIEYNQQTEHGVNFTLMLPTKISLPPSKAS
jgi:C4-dicarboxylate-specific signal transduction histidine kinase